MQITHIDAPWRLATTCCWALLAALAWTRVAEKFNDLPVIQLSLSIVTFVAVGLILHAGRSAQALVCYVLASLTGILIAPAPIAATTLFLLTAIALIVFSLHETSEVTA